MRNNKEIEELRDDVVKITKLSSANAIKYVTKFKKYEYLWITDRDKYLQQFLVYGRGLTPEEELQLETGDPEFKVKENKPTLDVFREQVI